MQLALMELDALMTLIKDQIRTPEQIEKRMILPTPKFKYMILFEPQAASIRSQDIR